MGCCTAGDDDKNEEETKQLGEVKGPAGDRGCTDIICLLIFIAHWVGFVFIAIAAIAGGNPTKLYKPRDYRGDYCGVEENWNNGVNTKDAPKMAFMMNVTEMLNQPAKDLLCGSMAQSALNPSSNNGVLTAQEYTDYLCACCISPCASCMGSYPSADVGAVSNKMAAFTGGGSDLFSAGGANGDLFSSLWENVEKYFIKVCVKSCSSASTAKATANTDREYAYKPLPNDPMYIPWYKLGLSTSSNTNVQTLKTAMNQMKLQAVPTSECPYDPQLCVPTPGVEFEETPADSGFCLFKMGAQAANAVGTAAAGSFEDLGAKGAAEDLEKSFGDFVGDFERQLGDAFILTAISSFIVGFIFLVLLRCFVGIIVWLSILIVFIMFLLSGALLLIRSGQCKGVGIFDSGKQSGNALVTVASAAADGTDLSSESCSGNCVDYKGTQTKTMTGRTCQKWGCTAGSANCPNTNTVYTPERFTSANFPDQYALNQYMLNPVGTDGKIQTIVATAGTEGNNFCRNPGTANGIWCYTRDTSQAWERCLPIGVIQGECAMGYEVTDKTMRDICWVCGWIVMALALIWVLFICCMCSRIRLAIAINQAAATFVGQTPQILIVPLVSFAVGFIWILLWSWLTMFMISTVPDGYMSKESYATYKEAVGTDDDIGKCNDKWPTGSTYHIVEKSGACAGNNGDITGITPKCWGCAPPRYMISSPIPQGKDFGEVLLGWSFWYSLFCYLWNAALIIAIGQCTIAGAVAAWFFAPTDSKRSAPKLRPGVVNCFRYHLGSLAFGAFIIALVQFIRYVLMYFEQQAKAQKNKIMVIVLKVAQCCLWCLEKCIKFLNKNAYIQIALMGTNFCVSAKNAFYIILRNFARFGLIAALGTAINAIGVLFIVAGTTILGYLYLKAFHPEMSPVIPLIMYVFLGYLVAKLFMNVFLMAVDTMLQCWIATEEMGGDKGEFLPASFASFVQDNVDKSKDKDNA